MQRGRYFLTPCTLNLLCFVWIKWKPYKHTLESNPSSPPNALTELQNPVDPMQPKRCKTFTRPKTLNLNLQQPADPKNPNLLLMILIVHYLKDPKPWKLWYVPYDGQCRICIINRMRTLNAPRLKRKSFACLQFQELRLGQHGFPATRCSKMWSRVIKKVCVGMYVCMHVHIHMYVYVWYMYVYMCMCMDM